MNVVIGGAALVGKSFLSKAISELYTDIKDSTKHIQFSKVIEELDIKYDMEVIEALLIDVEDRKKEDWNSVQVCIDQIHTAVTKIKEEIENINLKIIEQQYSNRLSWKDPNYYLNWNTFNYDENLNRLRKNKNTLDKRINTLIKVLSINLQN